jgi:acyl-CoA hydrolase
MTNSVFPSPGRRRGTPADINIAKTIADSRITITRNMGIADANGHGNVHGGVIMRIVDEAAAIVAVKHCGRPVVTARIDRLNFLAPVHIGELVHLYGEMECVGRTSMDIKVEVTAENISTGDKRKVCTATLVFVGLDDDWKPAPVPPLEASNPEEEVKITRAKARRERLKKIEEELGE